MSEEHLPLAGRRAVITGAGRGIGRSVALALASAGADVALSARSRSELEQVAGAVEALGRRALAIPCDVTDPAQVERMVADAVAGLGGIDILVNNASAFGSADNEEAWVASLVVRSRCDIRLRE